jgi:enoyl-CoA hydratase/carnithine racemase
MNPVDFALTDGVLHITLQVPARRNALSLELLERLREVIERHRDQGVHAATLTGSGGTFSAGADLADLSGTPADVRVDEAITRATGAITDAPFPVIAAVEGACIGAAVDLALACEVRVASTTAFFEVPATRLGILYNPTAIARMRRAVPRQTLTRLLVFGQRLDAGVALTAGVVAMLTPAGQAEAAATELASSLAKTDPAAVAATKALLGALDRDEFDPESWQQRRLALLGSRHRANAITAAQARTTPSESTEPEDA